MAGDGRCGFWRERWEEGLVKGDREMEGRGIIEWKDVWKSNWEKEEVVENVEKQKEIE